MLLSLLIYDLYAPTRAYLLAKDELDEKGLCRMLMAKLAKIKFTIITPKQVKIDFSSS
jgi:hypothetical protein